MKFVKGMHRDANPIDQPVGTWRYAKNIVIPPGSGSVQSEHGTELVVNITAGYSALGSIVLHDDTVIIFSVLPDATNPATLPGISEVGLFDPVGNTYIVLFNDFAQAPGGKQTLDFKQAYPIQGTYKITATGKISIYWTDDHSEMKYLKVHEPPTTGTAFDLSTMFVFPSINKVSEIDFTSIIGGALLTGAYTLVLAYIDSGGTPTGYITTSKVVYVNMDAESVATTDIGFIGPSSSGFVTAGNAARYSPSSYNGVASATPTGKGIKWKVSNLDFNYEFLRPAILMNIGGVISAIGIPDKNYTVGMTSVDITYTGQEQSETVLLEDIQIPNQGYTRAKTVTQVDDVLYWGNMVRATPDIDYQKYACSIVITANEANPTFSYAAQNINGDSVFFRPDSAQGAGKSALHTTKYKGYQRDEVYAFYISWIMSDGNETVAYHIPGRDPVTLPNTYAGAGITEDQRVDDATTTIPATSESLDLNNPMIGKVTTIGANEPNSNGMGYWENESEKYPTTVNSDFIGLDHLGNVTRNLENTQVKHHHFPSSALGEGGGHIYKSFGTPGDSNFAINPLGFKVSNIPIPQELLGKVKAFKIYYAKREEINTTVIDTGIFNFTPSYTPEPSATTWGYPGAHFATSLPYLINGPAIVHLDCAAGACNPYNLTYPIQSPPDVGGEVVATPFSCCHAPYNDNEDGVNLGPVPANASTQSNKRKSWAAKGTSMTFNGLHTRVSDPDISGIDYIKVTKHLRIGETGSTHQHSGITFFRENESGTTYSGFGKSPWFLDWTRMPWAEYNHKTNAGLPGSHYDVDASMGNDKFPNIRALKAKYNVATDTTTSVPGTLAKVNNKGGDQTTYLEIYRPIWAHDMGRTTMNVYESQIGPMYEALLTFGGGTWTDFPIYNPNMSTNLLNAYPAEHMTDNVGGQTQTNRDLGIQKPYQHNNESWEEGWASSRPWYTSSSIENLGSPYPKVDSSFYYTSTTPDYWVQYHAYGGVHKYMTDVYTPFTQQYNLIHTGFTKPVDAITVPQMYNPGDEIFGGDTFIGYYTETRHMQQEGWEHPEYSGYWSNGKIYYHYAYGYLGNVGHKTGTEYCQQLYVTESKINIINRYSEGNPNEDYYPFVYRESDALNANFSTTPRIFSYDRAMSYLNDFKNTLPFDPAYKNTAISDFPTRVIRSVKHNREGYVDNFRIYKPDQYRDLPRNRGELWNLSSFDNVLLPILERSLLKTKGKEDLNLSTTSSIALGSGDLFENEPDEVLFTDRGYGGTLSQFGVATSKYGHFSVDKVTGKVFLLAKELEEISNYGLTEFLQKRLTAWGLKDYGLPYNVDIPTMGVGIISTWDPKYSRYIITKVDKIPRTTFITAYDAGTISWNGDIRHYVDTSGSSAVAILWDDTSYFTDTNWTISYYPALKVWGSLHDFYPRMYFYTNTNFYSLITGEIHVHNYEEGSSLSNAGVDYNIGTYYGTNNDIIFEYIDNEAPSDNKLYSNFYYTADIEVPSNDESGIRHEVHNSGFDHFYVYNSHQLTWGAIIRDPGGTNNQLWLPATSARRKERTWYVKGFRDNRMESTLVANTTLDAPINTPILSTNLLLADINIQLNSAGLKTWDKRRKFVDKWVAIRLVQNRFNDNTSGTGKFLVTLHSAGTTKRKTYR